MVTSEVPMRPRRTRPHAVVLPAVAESIPHARAGAVAAAAQCGLRGEALDGLRLAVSEAVTNAVRHAYQGEAPGDVRVTLDVSGDELIVLIEDDGCGPDRPSPVPGLGWGRAVMDRVSDGFAIERRDCGGTRVRLRFHRR